MMRALSMLRNAVCKLVDASSARPWVTLVLTLLAMALSGFSASRLELKTDIRELLPRDSPDYQAWEKQAGRIGGGATLFVVAESSHRAANQHFIDALTDRLKTAADQRQSCRAACTDDSCRQRCGADLIRYVEGHVKDVRQFFDTHQWMYAKIADLQAADEDLDFRIASKSGLVEDLGLDDEGPAAKGTQGTPSAPAPKAAPKSRNLESQSQELDRMLAQMGVDFPSGYFETTDGKMIGLRIVARTTGMGDQDGFRLLNQVKDLVKQMKPESFAPDLRVGFAGDIPNALEEQDSIASEAIWVTAIAATLILGGVVFFYRSPWSLVIIGIPAIFGATTGYAFATAAYGYVNTVGAFLGAIIIGNGINYPIVLLSRYRDFRARGIPADQARREAVLNAFRAELVGASVAAIAYGSLTITRFRGFSQFGTIGFVGMLSVWLAIVPLVPALVVLVERLQPKLPLWLRDPPPKVTEEGASGPVTQALSHWVERFPGPILIAAALLAAVALWKLPAYFQDPWEYDFSKLSSKTTAKEGAGAWSSKADKVFGGRGNVAGAMMVADSPAQVPLIKKQILTTDAQSPTGPVIDDIVTLWDLLPGTPVEQQAKLVVLKRLQDRLTPRVIDSLEPKEQEYAKKLKNNQELRVVGPQDLPPLYQRRFQENNGTLGTVYYVKYKDGLRHSDGKDLLRMAAATENVTLPDGTQVITASRPGMFAEMIRSMAHDGPLATVASFLAVAVVVILATGSAWGAMSVLAALILGVLWMVGAMALLDIKLNFLNFIALPITFGIGCEYPFNLFDRARLLSGDVALAVRRSAGPVALCSYTTLLGYGSLAFADNQALQSFGIVAASGELACTTAALVVLPALLHWMNRRPKWKKRWARQPTLMS